MKVLPVALIPIIIELIRGQQLNYILLLVALIVILGLFTILFYTGFYDKLKHKLLTNLNHD
ncbi:hypothetical protein FC83_GL003344 [Agrilactobacillus composti DSM 18527 = JCM 14202]|uniref:Uncharacterized protein n=1 Tax=Agrilactobacillus composti DSM 18527 = JCM 14202 TaxID=1423734 RepID=A0A0R1XZ45_9LACO|nr:hypothetical protein FC83_GL003344 [Agrilactobacillus composti DSM 18527 = JCM 14202]